MGRQSRLVWGLMLVSGCASEAEVAWGFVDATTAAGLLIPQAVDPCDTPCKGTPEECVVPWMTGGVAAGDVDDDGDVDLFLTRMDGPDALYLNDGDAGFVDAAADWGLTGAYPSNGAALFDADADGRLDLVVGTVGGERLRLYLQTEPGRFEEAPDAAGLAMADGTAHQVFSICPGDFDGDGWTDLVTTEWSPPSDVENGCDGHARLFRNTGGAFEDVTAAAGACPVDDPSQEFYRPGRWSFSAAFVDLNGDAWPDLAIAGDFGTSQLLSNDGAGGFVDETKAAGVNRASNGMGQAFADVDGDGRLDWFETSVTWPESYGPANVAAGGNRLYRATGGGAFEEVSATVGVRDGGWGWGAVATDLDLDGDVDVAMVGGDDYCNYPAVIPDNPMRLWRNDGWPTMVETASAAGLTSRIRGRALLATDLDGDGDPDLLLTRSRETPILYRNDAASRNRWLTVVVPRAPGPRPMPIRAEVTVGAGDAPMVRSMSGCGFLSVAEPVAYFGLGAAERVAHVRVVFAGGAEVTMDDVAANQRLAVPPPQR